VTSDVKKYLKGEFGNQQQLKMSGANWVTGEEEKSCIWLVGK
jgi:hypothetical protein